MREGPFVAIMTAASEKELIQAELGIHNGWTLDDYEIMPCLRIRS
jgi:hypothetical protein